MEPNRPPKVANILVFHSHFTKHVIVYVTPNQTTKTVAMFLYQGYIVIFVALARLRSDHGVNFTINIISEMCQLLGIKKVYTMPYHPQTNGLVESSHQTIMWIIGKLGEDKKADWPDHLAEIVHAYNGTWSAMMGYSPHYLMFGHRPRLPVDFYFPTLRSTEVPKRGTFHQACGGIHSYCLRPLEGHPPRGPSPVNSRSSKTEMVLWLENRYCRFEAWWSHLSQSRCLSREEEDHGQMGGQASWGGVSDCDRWPLIWSEEPAGKFMCPTSQLFLVMSEVGVPLCVGVCQVWDRCTSPILVKPTPGVSDSKTTPQEDNGLTITQHQPRKTPLGWINGKLWLLPWMSARAATEDGWRFQVMCSGHGCLPWQNGQKTHVHLVEGQTLTHRYQWIADWTTTTTAHRSGMW